MESNKQLQELLGEYDFGTVQAVVMCPQICVDLLSIALKSWVVSSDEERF